MTNTSEHIVHLKSDGNLKREPIIISETEERRFAVKQHAVNIRCTAMFTTPSVIGKTTVTDVSLERKPTAQYRNPDIIRNTGTDLRNRTAVTRPGKGTRTETVIFVTPALLHADRHAQPFIIQVHVQLMHIPISL